MPLKNKRLRIMAGPNGSGKSTVLAAVQKNYYSRPFVNADEIEKSLHQKRALSLLQYHLTVDDDAIAAFMETAGKSWTEKAVKENSSIAIQLHNNTLITGSNPNAYDAAKVKILLSWKLAGDKILYLR